MKLFLILIPFILFSRENPFFPLDGDNDFKTSTNVIDTFDALKVQEIKLPDSARVLKNIALTYQNLDGSITIKELKLNNSIDWHIPITITQETNKKSNSVMVDKQKTLIPKKNNTQKNIYSKIYQYKFITFYQSDRFVKVITNDSLIRKFMVVNPHRIVLDFKRDALFLSKRKSLNNKFYKEIRLGNHDGYYRVVFELDGKYRYKIEKKKYGYLVEVY